MDAPGETTTEIIALALLHSAVRAREIGGGLVTYRRSLAGIVPGQRLTIAVEKRWRFRKTDMLGGTLLHAGFSLRALQHAGYLVPTPTPAGLSSPGDGDDRLREGLLALEAGQWPVARCLFLDVLEDHPGCLVAHAALGRLLADLEHRETAMLHLTASVRLGLGAVAGDASLPLDPTRETERALLEAMVARARLLIATGRIDDAACDLRRALSWDPTDSAGAAKPLAGLLAASLEPLRMAAGTAP